MQTTDDLAKVVGDLTREMQVLKGATDCLKPNVTLVLVSDRETGKADRALEKRVGITPGQVRLIRELLAEIEIVCTVLVVRGAGERAGFSDHDYVTNGAEIVDWWELEHLESEPDVVHGLKEPGEREAKIRAPFLRIGALHTGDFGHEATFLRLIADGVGIFDGSSIGSDFRVPVRGSMSRFAGRVSAEKLIRHLNRREMAGAVTVVGAGYAGRAAVATLLHSERVEKVYLFEDEARVDFVRTLMTEYSDNDRVDVRTCSGRDDERLIESMGGCVGLILAVATRGRTTPEILHVHRLQALQREAIVIDISIDEGGAIVAPALRHGWRHERVIAHLTSVVADLGRHYWALANMPRVYPGEASVVHGETILPYLLTLLFHCAMEGGPVRALEHIQRLRPAQLPPDVKVSTRTRLDGLTRDLRNGLAFGRKDTRVLIERIVASKAAIAAYLVSRRIAFEVELRPGDDFVLDGLPAVQGCIQDALELGITCRLIHHPDHAADSPRTAAMALGVPQKLALKCLLIDEGTSTRAAVIPGDRVLAKEWLGDRQLLDPDHALARLQFPAKNVPLLSVLRRLDTDVDHSVFGLGHVLASAGHEHLSIRFEASDLRLSRARRTHLIAKDGRVKAAEACIRHVQRDLGKALELNDDSLAEEALAALRRVLEEP